MHFVLIYLLYSHRIHTATTDGHLIVDNYNIIYSNTTRLILFPPHLIIVKERDEFEYGMWNR